MAKSTNLKQFIANVKVGGLMKSSRYSILMTPPTSLIKYNTDLRKILLFCSAVSIPGVNLATTQIRTFGEVRETPYDRIFDNVNMTFYVDQDMRVKEYFDNWMNSIQDTETRTFEYYNNYITTILIYVEDARDDSRYLVQLEECYPKQINPIQLSYDNKDTMKLEVSMNYKYWRHYKLAASKGAEPGAWDSVFKLPTLNDREIGDYFGTFGANDDPTSGTYGQYGLPQEIRDTFTGITDNINLF